MTDGLPKRSVNRPEIGDRAYIPNVWALMTRPTATRSCPWDVMWSGVMVMTSTITTCTAMSATIATQTLGRCSSARIGSPCPSASSCRAEGSASSYGSGRSSTNERIAAAATKTAGSK